MTVVNVWRYASLLSALVVAWLCSVAQAQAQFTTTPCTAGEIGTCRLVNDLTLANVNATIAASAAGSGTAYQDGVYIKAGSATWSSPVAVGPKNGLVLKGGVGGTTTITCSSTCITVIDGDHTRVTGFNFVGTTGTGEAWYCQGMVTDARFDHNNVSGGGASSNMWGIQTADESDCTGVVDHNAFTHSSANSGGLYVQGKNYTTFLTAINWNSGNFLFFEDNTWLTNTGGDYFETHHGGKVVFRHNVTTEGAQSLSSYWDQHNGGISQSAGRAIIVHDNVLNYTRTQNDYRRYMFFRGGTGLVYNNIVDWHLAQAPSGMIELIDFRAVGGDPWTSGGCASADSDEPATFICPTCRAACVSTAYHPNGVGKSPQGEGYPGIGAPGVGVFHGTHEPWYFWNNRKIITGTTQVQMALSDISVINGTGWSVALNRDYCYSASATQPTSCGGVPLNYTPYPYPHPLVAGGGGGGGGAGGDTIPPNAPTNLRIQ